MSSKLISLSPYEAPNQLALSLTQSYSFFLPKLTPPLHLILPSPEDYPTLNQAILYGFLCDPTLSKPCLKHLHAIVNDGYEVFVKLVAQVVDELYGKLLEWPKVQLVWVVGVMVDVAGVGVGRVLVGLLRQIVGGDFSDGNLWLSHEMVGLFLAKWDLILEENPVVLTYGLYTYLRLLSDHYRLPQSPRSMDLKKKEIGFCVRMLREQFSLCLEIGRDLIRLLQDLAHIPEFRAVWKDLVLNPVSFGVTGFEDVSSIYALRTPSEYFSLRVTPEMETWLRFLLANVKLGNQRRHQLWFARKFLFAPERESLICDMVRFVCCACRPSEEALRNGIVPRWAVIGWLLTCCTKKYVEANVKLALFYDWLFFDDKVDGDVMSVEPAMLLMVNSIPRYVDMTQSLLDFLLLLVENYDVDRKNFVLNGVWCTMTASVRKGVISSLDVLTSCELLSPFLRKRLHNFMSTAKPVTVEEPPPLVSYSHDDDLGNMIAKIGENMKTSIKMGQETVGKILAFLVNPDSHEKLGDFSPELVASEIKKQLDLAGYRLFGPIENVPVDVDGDDDEVQSVTSMVIQTSIFSQHQCFTEMLMSWSRNGLPTRERLLSYVARLAYEAHLAGHGDDFSCEIDYQSLMPLLKSHIEGYMTFLSRSEPDTGETVTPPFKVDQKLISKVLDGAFRSYRIMLKRSDLSLGKGLSGDIMSCSLWKNGNPRALFQVVFSYLSDLARGDENVILLLVSNLDQLDIVSVQIDLTLKRFSIFGKDIESILRVVRKSMFWEPVKQHKLWGLMRSEFSVSEFPVEKLLLDFFSEELDPRACSIAVEGIMVICSSHVPTPELVGAVLLLPNNKFPDFVAAILSQWVTTNVAMLFNSIADFLGKLENKDESIALDWGGIIINQSAILFLLKYLEAQGEQGVEMLGKLALSLSGGKKGIIMENPDVAMDTS